MVVIKFSGKSYCMACKQVDNFFSQRKIDPRSYSFFSEGKKIGSFHHIVETSFIQVLIPLKGGKGGYGAKLKTQGGKKVRPNDNMFSRDTQGRKIAYSTMQREYRQFYSQRQEEDQKVKKQLAEFKVVESTLKEEHAFMKLDKTYNSELEDTEKKLKESMKVGVHKYFSKRQTSKQLKKQKEKSSEEVQIKQEGEVKEVKEVKERSEANDDEKKGVELIEIEGERFSGKQTEKQENKEVSQIKQKWERIHHEQNEECENQKLKSGVQEINMNKKEKEKVRGEKNINFVAAKNMLKNIFKN